MWYKPWKRCYSVIRLSVTSLSATVSAMEKSFVTPLGCIHSCLRLHKHICSLCKIETGVSYQIFSIRFCWTLCGPSACPHAPHWFLCPRQSKWGALWEDLYRRTRSSVAGRQLIKAAQRKRIFCRMYSPLQLQVCLSEYLHNSCTSVSNIICFLSIGLWTQVEKYLLHKKWTQTPIWYLFCCLFWFSNWAEQKNMPMLYR